MTERPTAPEGPPCRQYITGLGGDRLCEYYPKPYPKVCCQECGRRLGVLWALLAQTRYGHNCDEFDLQTKRWVDKTGEVYPYKIR